MTSYLLLAAGIRALAGMTRLVAGMSAGGARLGALLRTLLLLHRCRCRRLHAGAVVTDFVALVEATGERLVTKVAA